jgi:hypothetical protein
MRFRAFGGCIIGLVRVKRFVGRLWDLFFLKKSRADFSVTFFSNHSTNRQGSTSTLRLSCQYFLVVLSLSSGPLMICRLTLASLPRTIFA